MQIGFSAAESGTLGDYNLEAGSDLAEAVAFVNYNTVLRAIILHALQC